jgi:uncharacterized protein (TIGR03000 family)
MTVNYLRRVTTTAIVAIAGLLVTVGQSYAQQNSTVFPWQGGGQGGSSIYRDAAFPPAAPAFYPPAAVESSRAFYPSAATSDKVLVNVTVPANAKVTFQGANTTQTGTYRRFVSPLIAAGYQYAYEIQAVWTENGREVRQTRSIPVQPGDVVNVTVTRDAVTVRPER